MNVQDLIDRLSECDPAAEVLLATQPGWPMQSALGGIATSHDLAAETACEEHEHYNCDECAGQADPVVYLVEGQQAPHPYAPRGAWSVAS